MVVLEVTVDDDERFTEHISKTIEACSRSLYPLREFRAHRLPRGALHIFAKATTVTELLYAVHAWLGFS